MLAGKVDYVYLDRMNYLSTVKRFYEGYGLQDAMTDAFFDRSKRELVASLKRNGISSEQLF